MRDVCQKLQRFEFFFSVYIAFLSRKYLLFEELICVFLCNARSSHISWHGQNTLCHKQLWYNIFMIIEKHMHALAEERDTL